MKATCNYPDFNEFENRLIMRIAAEVAIRFHLSAQDREDVQQELAYFLWQRRSGYDPEHASRCGYETYITKCLERKSIEILRSVCSDIAFESADTPATHSDRKTGAAADIDALYRITTSSAFTKLTPEQKEIFKQLVAGKSIARIAEESGVRYPTMHCRVRRLRAVLQKNGFDFSLN